MRTWTRGFPSQDCSWFGIGGGPAVHNEWTRGFPSQGYPWFGLVRLLLTVTGNPAIHASMDPWLSVPGLPLVWHVEAARLSTQLWTRGFLSQGYPWFSDCFGNPAVHENMDPWLSVPGLPLVWRACHPFISISGLLKEKNGYGIPGLSKIEGFPEHAAFLYELRPYPGET